MNDDSVPSQGPLELLLDRVPDPVCEPTIGILACTLLDLAACPDRWWPLLRFGPQPFCAELPGDPRVSVMTWPPGHRAACPGAADAPGTLILLAGELEERLVSTAGAEIWPLRPNHVRVHCRGPLRELYNPGPTYSAFLFADQHQTRRAAKRAS